jgi:hypothetical protein
MRTLQSIWFTLLAAVAVLAPTIWGLSSGVVSRELGLPLAFGGILLLFDWQFGIWMLPRLLSPARIGSEARYAEHIMYSFRFAMPRYGAVLAFALAMWVGLATFGDGDWQIWPVIVAIIGYGIAMFFQSFRAIEQAVQQALREVH